MEVSTSESRQRNHGVTSDFSEPVVRRLVEFVRACGMKVEASNLPGGTLLPGLDIACGVLSIDETRLLYPGDILHEAGHIAVTSPDVRGGSTFSSTPGEEMAAMLGHERGAPRCSNARRSAVSAHATMVAWIEMRSAK